MDWISGGDCLDLADTGHRQALRNYSLGRMKSLAVTKRGFVRPADFSPEKYFGKAFGAFVGTGDYRVIVRFSPEAALQIRDRSWHESQESRDLPDGSLELAHHVGGLEEIQRWILSWADQAEVIAPDELKRIVHLRATATAQKYQP